MSSIFKDPSEQRDQAFTEIEFTDGARRYLRGLLEAQEEDVLGIRVFINDPGTPRAETCIAYCREEDLSDDVILREYDVPAAEEDGPEDGEGQAADKQAGQATQPFKAYFESNSWEYLDAAKIDFAEDRMGGQLTIKAPNSKTPQVHADSPLKDRINYLLFTEVNPSLAAHGGEVSLVTIDDENFAILRFGGGCQGCSAVDMTLKDGVEKTLREHLPDLAGVKDMTDHTDKSNAYY